MPKLATLRILSVFGFLLTGISSPSLLQAQDRTPPSAPSALTTRLMTCRQVDLSWAASIDNAGGSGLKVYIIHRSDGVESTIVATHTTFSDAKRLTPSPALTYTVSARDFAGNESASSNAVTVTTPACSGNEHGFGDFEGKFEVLVEDHTAGESRILYFLQTDKDHFPINFEANAPKRLR